MRKKRNRCNIDDPFVDSDKPIKELAMDDMNTATDSATPKFKIPGNVIQYRFYWTKWSYVTESDFANSEDEACEKIKTGNLIAIYRDKGILRYVTYTGAKGKVPTPESEFHLAYP